MTSPRTYLAFDFGAESGRAVSGTFAENRLFLDEVHRFPNGPHNIGDRLYWDVLYLFAELKRGIAIAAAQRPLNGIGIDTWGVDFGLLDRRGDLIGNPVHYRDSRTDGILDRAFHIVPREELFAQTGIQFLQFNTLFQLYAMSLMNPGTLELADRLLMMPDLFNYWLTGVATNEYTATTTTQCYNTTKREWAWPIIDAFKLPQRLFGEITPPAKLLGELRPAIRAELDIGELPVLLPATHDTGSAVVAIPARHRSWAYISCGTWSLIGAETREPIVNERSLAHNFTNEGGAFGTNRLLCNVMGLWLLQGARRSWSRQGIEWTYEQLIKAAGKAAPFASIIDPDDHDFLNPRDMLEAIRDYCRKTGQTPPAEPGEVTRCIIESLAMKYRLKIECIEDLLGQKIEAIYIVGGGSRNKMLCQATADACGRVVIAGPAEGTAMGNLLVQAAAMGDVSGLEHAREIVRASAEIEEYEPANPGTWDQPYEKFTHLLKLATPAQKPQ